MSRSLASDKYFLHRAELHLLICTKTQINCQRNRHGKKTIFAKDIGVANGPWTQTCCVFRVRMAHSLCMPLIVLPCWAAASASCVGLVTFSGFVGFKISISAANFVWLYVRCFFFFLLYFLWGLSRLRLARETSLPRQQILNFS
jgi:hypothetical protein